MKNLQTISHPQKGSIQFNYGSFKLSMFMGFNNPNELSLIEFSIIENGIIRSDSISHIFAHDVPEVLHMFSTQSHNADSAVKALNEF